MTLELSYDELLRYTDGERAKWRRWFEAQPDDVWRAPVQKEGTLADVWTLADHIFLVELRHVQRLQRKTELAEQTGVARGDAPALWDFAGRARQELRALAGAITPGDAAAPRKLQVRNGTHTLTPRKLLFHILLHEIRHWAQIATAVRNAGFPPPGGHDLFYSDALA
jgi:uncharacterized damage-inducible protein DinB